MKKVIFILSILMIGCITFGCKKNEGTEISTEHSVNEVQEENNDISSTAPTSSAVNNETKDNKDINIKNEIPEGFVYIAASYNYDLVDSPTGTVTIYHKNWEPLTTFDKAFYEGNLGLIPSDSTILIQNAVLQENGSYALKCGLYSIKRQELIVPADYDFMTKIDEENGYFIGTDLVEYTIFDSNGNILKTGKSSQMVDVIKQGDYYWEFESVEYSKKLESEIIRIYDSNFKLVREVEKYYKDYPVLNNDGTLYFSKSKFLEHFGYKDKPDDTFYLVSCSIDEPLIIVSYNGTLMVLDKNYNIIAEKLDPGDGKSTFYTYSDIYADINWDAATNSSSITFYDLSGKVVKDKNGNPYTNIIHDYYWLNDHEQVLYNYTNGVLNILRYNNGKEYHFNIDDWKDFSVGYIFEDMIILWKEGKELETKIYKDNNLLYDLEGIYYVENTKVKISDRMALVKYGSETEKNYYFLLDRKGNKLYVSPMDEEISSIDDKLIQISRENNWGVIDYDGNYIIKEVKK